MKSVFSHKLATLLAVVFAVMLAGCGGSSNTMDDEVVTPDPKVTAAEKAQMEAEAKAAAAEKEKMEAEAAKAKAEEEAAKLRMAEEEREAAEQAAKEEADRTAMNAMAKKLHAGLGVTGEAALTVTAVTMSGGMLTGMVDPDGSGDTAAASINLPMSGAVTPSISGWNGMEYVKTMDGVTNHAVVYTNPGAPTRQRFEEKHADIIEASGQVPQSEFATFIVSGSDFASGAGNVTHEVPTGADYVSVRGTFDGAPGSFRCAASCTSSVSDSAGVSLSSGWYFIADTGAMTSTPDADYIMFGWWARDTGPAVGVDTFVETVGAAAASGDINTLEGGATYIGGASGKVAVYSPLSEGNEAGAFTAKATLTAKFGAANAGGMISGTLTDFSVDDRANDWSVSLKEAPIADGASTFAGPQARTEWTIGGVTAAESGMWQGTLYETADSGVPMTAAGTFRSAYGTVGHMSGAFGATHNNE